MSIGLAIQAFFKILFNREAAAAYQRLTSGEAADQPTPAAAEPTPAEAPAKAQAPAPPKPTRSDAIGLLAALQREARFVDLVQESLDAYSDEQVGAAARDVLRDTKKVLDRMFAIAPLTESEEGDSMQTPAEVDPGQIRLTGNVHGDAPFSGTIAHHGWKAAKCELPRWSGSPESDRVIAPIELEIA
ncbi:hypothetical protein Poly24_22290 [Rosistilla carotiformis]|uniref:DUF2760 domain-containing protein n=1 Tax=Rosistilla carotiformis TaxID=2528017 RepID=A0A518JSK5_9BACT|nr:DUF2760 domain-containing protein [Rosistilla carotiformis]QDV68520.1 hypothetical protein Poly24_22290 [Rosistilla carotiformis]